MNNKGNEMLWVVASMVLAANAFAWFSPNDNFKKGEPVGAISANL